MRYQSKCILHGLSSTVFERRSHRGLVAADEGKNILLWFTVIRSLQLFIFTGIYFHLELSLRYCSPFCLNWCL